MQSVEEFLGDLSTASPSFSYDENFVGDLLSRTTGPSTIDDNFDLSQFDWILRRSVVLGVQDHTHFFRQTLQKVGEGVNFKVYRCLTQLSLVPETPEKEVALKRLKLEVYIGRTRISSWEQDALKSLLREVYTMSALSRHPNILNIYGFGSDHLNLENLSAPDILSYRPFLVVEYAQLGTVADYLRISKCRLPLSEHQPPPAAGLSVRIKLCFDIGNGIRALHQQGFIHRDIKPHNVLVFEDSQGSVMAKLSDFGMTLFHGSDAGAHFNVLQYFGGTEQYTAPELATRSTQDLTIEEMRKGDIFSYGVTCFETLSSTEYIPASHIPASNAHDSLLAMLEPALHHATIAERTTINQLLAQTVCTQNARASDLNEILGSFSGNILAIANHENIPESEISTTQWPVADSISANVFSTPSWNFLDGDGELIKSTGVGARLNSLAVAAPWAMQRCLYTSIEMTTRLRDQKLGKLLFLQGLCFAIGFGADIDYKKAITLVFESAKVYYRPALYTFRRLHQALSTLQPHQSCESPWIEVDALRGIDPELHVQLRSIEQSHLDDYLPFACRLSEVDNWRETTLRSCPIALTYFTQTTIENCSTPANLQEMRSEILSLNAEAWNAYQTDKFYPIDYLLALAIVFDDADSVLFRKIAEPFGKILERWDFHFSGFSAPVAPLFVAARVGNVGAVRYLTEQGASPAYKSYLGMIPLHFLFMFDDTYTVEMATILSKNLVSTDSYHAYETCIPEQLCSLVGTPLAFSIQVNHRASIAALRTLQDVHRSTYTLKYQGGPAHILPGVSDPMAHWKGLGQLFDPLARVQWFDEPEDATALQNAFSQPESVLDLSIMLLMILRAWHMHRFSHWIAHGALYQTRLQETIWRISDVCIIQHRFESDRKVLLALEICLIVISSFHNENLLHALGTRVRYIMDPDDFDNRLGPLLASHIEESTYKDPHMHTMIGLFPRRNATAEQTNADLVLSYRCHDSLAFSRTLSHAYAHSENNQAEFVLHCIAISPSQDALIFVQLLNRYSTPQQAPPDMIHAAVRLAVRHGNQEALKAFFQVYGSSCLVGKDNVNIFHLMCVEDGFNELLKATIDFLGQGVVHRLLHSREGIAGLLPVQVALHRGSCICMQTALQCYIMEEAEFVDLLDTLIEFPFDFQLILTRLMRHFCVKTWYLRSFLTWYTGLYSLVESKEEALYIMADWHFQQSAALVQIGDCVSEIKGLEAEEQLGVRKSLEDRL